MRFMCSVRGQGVRAWQLVAALWVCVSLVWFGLPAAGAQAVGEISGLTVTSDTPGQLVVNWDVPSPTPHDYRVIWAKTSESFPSWTDPDGNAYPTTNSYTITGLEEGVEYKVRVRARGRDSQNRIANQSPWSARVEAVVADGDNGEESGDDAGTITLLDDKQSGAGEPPLPPETLKDLVTVEDAEPFEVPAGTFDLGNITGLDAERSHRFSVNGDDDAVDWFTFTLSRARTVGLDLSSLDSDIDLFLVDSNGGSVAASQNAGEAGESIESELAAGVYFVEVRANEEEHDTYVLSVSLDGESTADDPLTFEGPDGTIDLGDIAAVTSATESTVEYVHHIDTEQWYRFSLSRSREVDFRLLDVKQADSNGPLMELWSGAGDWLHDSSITNATYMTHNGRFPYPDKFYEFVDVRLDAGTYFVRVVPHNYYTGAAMVDDRIRFTYKTRTDVAAIPSGLTVRPAREGMKLAWKAPEANSEAVTGYAISRRLPYAADRSYRLVVADTGSQQTEYLDTTATADSTRYQYRVRARRGTVASEWSFSATGVYAATEAGDYANGTTTHGAVEVGGSTVGWVSEEGDVDYIKVELEGGRHYKVVVEPRAMAGWNLVVKLLEARDASDAAASPLGHQYLGTAQQYVLPDAAGDYFIVVTGGPAKARYRIGPYRVSVSDVTDSVYESLPAVSFPEADLDDGVSPESLSPDEWADLLETSDYLGPRPPYLYGRPIFDTNVRASDNIGVVAPGSSTYARLKTPGDADRDGDGEVDLDVDIIKMSLQEGRLYRIDVEGQDTGHGTLADPKIISMKGPGLVEVLSNGDEDSGPGRNARVFWTPTQSGDHYIAVMSECCGYVPDGQSKGSYRTGSYRVAVRDLTASLPAETEDTSTPATVPVGGHYVGLLGAIGEVDWVAMDLDADHVYTISASADEYPALGIQPVRAAGIRSIRDRLGAIVWSAPDCVHSREFTPTADGRYFVTVEERVVNSDSIGGYRVEVVETSAPSSDPGPDSSTTTPGDTPEEPIPPQEEQEEQEDQEEETPVLDDEPSSIIVNSPLNGSISEGDDTDGFTAQLEGGTTYVIDMEGAWTGAFDDDHNWVSIATLFDPIILGVYAADDPDTNLIPPGSRHDDAGEGKNSRLRFTPSATGNYRIVVGSGSGWTGTYVLTVTEAQGN